MKKKIFIETLKFLLLFSVLTLLVDYFIRHKTLNGQYFADRIIYLIITGVILFFLLLLFREKVKIK